MVVHAAASSSATDYSFGRPLGSNYWTILTVQWCALSSNVYSYRAWIRWRRLNTVSQAHNQGAIGIRWLSWVPQQLTVHRWRRLNTVSTQFTEARVPRLPDGV